MKRIITVIKDDKKTTRLGTDSASCLKGIKLCQQIPDCNLFTKDVIRKINRIKVPIELIANQAGVTK